MVQGNCNPKWYPVRYMGSLLWMGSLLAISFMEAPLKFQASSVTLSIGLEIGRLVFNTLNKMEWGFLIMIVLSFVLGSFDRSQMKWVLVIATILIIQTFYFLPILDQRAELIISGISPPSNASHLYYVVLEVFKLILLGIASYKFIYVRPE